MPKQKTILTLAISFIMIFNPLLVYGDVGGNKTRIIHIEEVSNDQALVFQRKLGEDGAPGFPIELQSLIAELDDYVKHQSQPIYPEDIQKFFYERGYEVSIVNSDHPDYLKPVEDLPWLSIGFGGGLVGSGGYYAFMGTMAFAASIGWIITIIGGVVLAVGYMKHNEIEIDYKTAGGDWQDQIMNKVRSLLSSWKEEMGTEVDDEISFFSVFEIME